MTAAEKAAKLEAYTAALGLLRHHASLCTEAESLAHDMEASLSRHISEVAAVKPSDVPEKRRGRGDG